MDSRPLCPLRRAPPRWTRGRPPARLTPALCSLSLQDMTDYVAYVAKDPINQRGEVPAGTGGPGGRADRRPVTRRRPQPATSWSAVRALPRASSAPWAKPSSCASSSTCTAPPGWSWPRKGTGPPRPVFLGTACARTVARRPGPATASSALGAVSALSRLSSVRLVGSWPRRRARPLVWEPRTDTPALPQLAKARIWGAALGGGPHFCRGPEGPCSAVRPDRHKSRHGGASRDPWAAGQQVRIYRHEVWTHVTLTCHQTLFFCCSLNHLKVLWLKREESILSSRAAACGQPAGSAAPSCLAHAVANFQTK